jgi:hypothetical protein
MALEVTKEDVEKLIEVEKTDTFLTHLKCFVLNKSIAMGTIEQRKISVWRPTIWNRAFYPVFDFEFNTQGHLIKINDRINPASKIYFLVIAIFFLSTFIMPVLYNFEFLGSVLYVLFVFSFTSLIFYVFYRNYLFEKKNQLEEIFEILDIETEKKVPKNEWSPGKTITRLLLYTFSIAVITLSILYIIPSGNYGLALGCITVFGTYLYIDLKILIKNKK